MGLLSLFQRRPASQAPVEAIDAVAQARTRARRRLIGAAVLVVIGIIGFPLVFETAPRPIPFDIPIDIPRKDGAPPLTMPPARPAIKPVQRDTTIDETLADAGREVPPPAAAASVAAPAGKASGSSTAAAAAASMPVARPVAMASAPKASAPEAVRKVDPPKSVPADAARAKALLDGQEAPRPSASGPSEAAGPRFVVQVGAFADANAARETRSKVERLGMKTYTQVVETPSGSRTRVRVGPFETREEADKALAKARAAGLNAAVLAL